MWLESDDQKARGTVADLSDVDGFLEKADSEDVTGTQSQGNVSKREKKTAG